MTALFVFTLNWNGEDKLKKLALSLAESIHGLSMVTNWCVRDNGSKDKSLDILKTYQKYQNLQLFEISHNRATFAEGMNFLFKESGASKTDLILLLNNDVEFKDAQSIQKMIKLHERTKADVVGARLLFNGTNKLQHAGVIFSKKYNLLPFHYRPGEESDTDAEKNRYFQAVTAACCLVTGSAFEKIGGFDTAFKWAFDDVDMCLQIGKFGKIAYCGETKIYHDESASLKKNPVNKMFMNTNVEYFRKKWSGKYEIDHDKYLKNPNYNEI